MSTFNDPVVTSPSRGLPTVQDCIRYIESCGWKYEYRNVIGERIFTGPTCDQVPGRTIGFTISELRHARLYGW